MNRFKDYFLIESILSESSEDGWKHWTLESHNHSVVDGHQVHISVDKDIGEGARQHCIRFKVNNGFSKGDIHPDTGRKIMLHVAKHVNGYVQNNVRKKDLITMTGYDHGEDAKNSKNNVYSLFAKRLATKMGGRYKSTKTKFMNSTIHQIRL